MLKVIACLAGKVLEVALEIWDKILPLLRMRV